VVWTAPHGLPGAPTGDRHTGNAPDGRLFISFRHDLESATKGDFAWVGTTATSLEEEGQYVG
jgi:hypothetical protein